MFPNKSRQFGEILTVSPHQCKVLMHVSLHLQTACGQGSDTARMVQSYIECPNEVSCAQKSACYGIGKDFGLPPSGPS
jgi:hypothetical protein